MFKLKIKGKKGISYLGQCFKTRSSQNPVYFVITKHHVFNNELDYYYLSTVSFKREAMKGSMGVNQFEDNLNRSGYIQVTDLEEIPSELKKYISISIDHVPI